MMKKLVTAICLTLAVLTPAFGQTIVGQPIHDFTLPDLNGAFVGPGQFKGKVLGIFLLGHD